MSLLANRGETSRAVSEARSFPGFEVTKDLKYDFHFAFELAFGSADDSAAAYERLRQKLIGYFLTRGHSLDAEYLADKVIDRVLAKVSNGHVDIKDDKSVSTYTWGVARYVDLEERRWNERQPSGLDPSYLRGLHPEDDSFEVERRSEALESCLEQLKPDERKLITEYYSERPGGTKGLAAELGISHSALRVRVMRIRKRLKEMMDQELNS